MSAMEEMRLMIGESREWESTSGTTTTHPILLGGENIADLTKIGGNWVASVNKYTNFAAYAVGETPEKAMRAALTSGIGRMAEALAKIRAMAVERGEELVALAEGLA